MPFAIRILVACTILQSLTVIAEAPPSIMPAPRSQTDRQPECRFDGLVLPRRLSILAAGAYAGRPLNQQIDQSGHAATRVDILVNFSDAPVVLMLGAYEPTVWNISWSINTRIVAVFASGYHRQAIAGLDRSVPTLVSTFDNAGLCGYSHVDEGKTGWLDPLARRLFGRAVKKIQIVKNGAMTIGNPALVKRAVTSPHTPPESYFDKSSALSGLPGLEDAVKKGLLRRATQQDASAWNLAIANSRTNRDISGDVPPIMAVDQPKLQVADLHNAYAVLNPFQLPDGLYGANSATFYVAAGVPIPTGNMGHSTMYDFNTLMCRGPSCIPQAN